MIEDDKADQAVFRRSLSAFDLTFVETGEAGLDRLGSEPFDLVLLAYLLPGVRGEIVLDHQATTSSGCWAGHERSAPARRSTR